MIIKELVCNPDGTQELVEHEIIDNSFVIATPEPTPEEKLRADVDYIAMVTGVEL